MNRTFVGNLQLSLTLAGIEWADQFNTSSIPVQFLARSGQPCRCLTYTPYRFQKSMLRLAAQQPPE
jgi:hypothetical protein